MKPIYANWDALDVTFHGTMPGATLDALAEAKAKAQERKGPVLVEIGGQPCLVEESGIRGFSFQWSTGDEGEIWFARHTSKDRGDWVLRCSVRAGAFAQHGGMTEIQDILYRRLDAYRFRGSDSAEGYREAVSRVDFAMDFHAPDFELEPENIVTRARKEGHLEAGIHWAGRRVSGVTIGKMPGRAVVIYDKGKEIADKGIDFWREVWGLDPREAGRVWRVELRAGKDELRERWNLRSISDVAGAAGDVFADLVEAVRYVLPEDQNITRCPPAPIWQAVAASLRAAMEGARRYLAPGRVIETTRARAQQTFLQMWRGMAVSYAVIMGREASPEGLEGLAGEVAAAVGRYAQTEPDRVREKLARARDRYHFITEAEEWTARRKTKDASGLLRWGLA